MFKSFPKVFTPFQTTFTRQALNSQSFLHASLPCAYPLSSISLFQPKCLARFGKKEPKITFPPPPPEMPVEELLAYLSDKDKKGKCRYAYNSKFVYNMPQEKKDEPKIPLTPKFWNILYSVQASIWIPLCYFIYTQAAYMHLTFAIMGFAMSFLTTRYVQRLMVGSVAKMELVNNEQVLLYNWANPSEGIICNIEGARVIKSKGFLDLGEGKNGRQPNYNFETEFIEAESGEKRKAFFLLSAEGSSIENVDLFKCIVHGKKSEIPNFKYLPYS